jgi:hypothetical protein
MCKILAYRVNKDLKKTSKKNKVKTPFNRILLQDSTVITLPIALKRIFQGCGGSASEAAVKCDFIIDQSTRKIIRVKLVAGRIPDVAMSADIIDHLSEGDLVIRDLGYFHLSQLSRIKGKKAHFISRLHKTAHIYLNEKDDDPLDLTAHLKKLRIENSNVDIKIYVGKNERLEVRLIGIKVPREVVETRRQKYKQNRKKDPSEEWLEWSGYTLMITDIPKESLSIKTVIELYRTRWQIELFFKNIKSNLGVDNFTGENKYRILCMIYIKIVLTITVANIYAFAQELAAAGFEVSLDKLIKWLKDGKRLEQVIFSGDSTILKRELERDLDLLCKQRRKEKCIIEDSNEDDVIGVDHENVA